MVQYLCILYEIIANELKNHPEEQNATTLM